MAVRIPSDLIVDVMRAASPQQAQMAAAKLKAVARPEAPGTMFTDALRSLQQPKPKADAYAQFETFMLRDAIEEMLPKAETGAFGEGFAGGVWRSMAAEQFASIFTEHGGLGIAEMMRKKAESAAPDSAGDRQWPYYRAAAISAYMPPVS
jgi:Rod binding domain-containing protein